MKTSYFLGLAVTICLFSASVKGEAPLSPTGTVEAFGAELKGKNFDKILELLYFPGESKPPALDEKMKERVITKLSNSLAFLLKGKIVASKETADFAVVTVCEVLKDQKPSANLRAIFLMKTNKEWKLSPAFVSPIPLKGVTDASQRTQFENLTKWHDKQAEIHARKFCSSIRVEKNQLPYKKKMQLKNGDALMIVLPDKKTLAIWCETNSFASLMGGEKLGLSYGERPFKSPEIEWIPQKDGGRVSGAYKSYIQSGGVITSSNTPGSEYILHVGGTHWVSLKTGETLKGKLPVSVSIREAVGVEKVNAQADVDYWFSELKQKDSKKRILAIEELHSLLSLGSIYAIPRWQEIVEQIRPLTKDPAPKVRKQAVSVLKALGGLDSIMKMIMPLPKADALKEYAAGQLAKSTKISKDRKGKKKVYDHVKTFLNSKNPKFRAFAVNFFAEADVIPEIRQQLISAQKDPSVEVRKAAVSAMVKVYPEEDIPVCDIF